MRSLPQGLPGTRTRWNTERLEYAVVPWNCINPGSAAGVEICFPGGRRAAVAQQQPSAHGGAPLCRLRGAAHF